MKAKAVYYRHHAKRCEEFSSLQAAIEFLQEGGDDNSLCAVAIIWEGKVIRKSSLETQESAEAECKEFMNG